ncbi:tetratricopeptide repeat protein [Aerosakkonema sp. BLCC-F183]|uniref:tetratricopeptide repeat protein n=1 Tax=Aerosakkonema sp. BLCC-F183 TaxID=3342834 RepID=UPI0035B85EF6
MSQGFVSREQELERLSTFLKRALNGETQVCFINGEAGTGKSRLIEEFVLQSERLDEKLLFTRSNCNAQTGISDPYIPFRIILGMLTGDNTNAITSQNAQRLSTVLRVSGRILLEVAPELIGTLIPGMGVVAALARAGAKERGLLRGLEERAIAAETNQSDIEQSQIFLQYTGLLRRLSEEYPLVIILDDLQWVDPASNALLFHLVRELRTCPILFVGLYRPSDVAAGRNHERHPLEPTLNEIKRIYGDVWIDLDQTTHLNGRAFVDALINSQPNKLSRVFRDVLFERTGGHALFTKELLRSMQERGDLIQDTDGYWLESPQLNWDRLPARVEGIIEERIGRLSNELREILNIACVEGQDFTVQVIAKIQKIRERELVSKLSRELERCHHLVQETGEVQLGKTVLSRYMFNHALFQVYLYSILSKAERRMLHTEVAETLEALCNEKTEMIAVQLAYHYTEASQTQKASTYLQLAGEQAFKLGEFNQARTFFNQALAAIGEDAGWNALNRSQLLWWIGETYYHTGFYRDAETHYRTSIEIARQLKDNNSITQGLVSLAQSLRRQHDSESAMIVAQEALSIARQTVNRSLECSAMRVLGIIYGQNNRNDERLSLYQEALQITDQIGDVVQKMACLNNLGAVYGEVFGNYPKAIEYYKKALELGQQHHRLSGQAIYLDNLAVSYRNLGNHEKAKSYMEQHLELTSKISNTQYTSVAYENWGVLLLHTNPDNIDLAVEQWQRSIEIADQYNRIETQVDSRNRLLISCLIKNQLDEALQVVEETKPLLKKFTANLNVYSETLLEAITYLRMEKLEEASYFFQRAKDTALEKLYSQRWAYRYHRAFAQAGIALLAPPSLRHDYLANATQYFQYAIDTCGWLGILNDALIILREIQKADPDGVLQLIEQELTGKRQIAWKNRLSND